MTSLMQEFHRGLLGFDNLLRELQSPSENYPRYNITKLEDGVRLDVLAPGLSKDDLDVAFSAGKLVISASKVETKKEPSYKLFSTKAFKKAFTVDPAYVVDDVELAKGILSITLTKIEEKDSHKLEITEK